jgi:hypothetical protein
MLAQYDAFARWRAQTGQEILREVNAQQVLQNPPALAHFLLQETQRILQALTPKSS